MEELIEAVQLERTRKGFWVGEMKGNLKKIIQGLAEKYDCVAELDKRGNPYFKTDKFRVGMHYSTLDNGKPTIDITIFNGKIFKIRCIP